MYTPYISYLIIIELRNDWELSITSIVYVADGSVRSKNFIEISFERVFKIPSALATGSHKTRIGPTVVCLLIMLPPNFVKAEWPEVNFETCHEAMRLVDNSGMLTRCVFLIEIAGMCMN